MWSQGLPITPQAVSERKSINAESSHIWNFSFPKFPTKQNRKSTRNTTTTTTTTQSNCWQRLSKGDHHANMLITLSFLVRWSSTIHSMNGNEWGFSLILTSRRNCYRRDVQTKSRELLHVTLNANASTTAAPSRQAAYHYYLSSKCSNKRFTAQALLRCFHFYWCAWNHNLTLAKTSL
jgi:hypothetical protein